MRIRPQLRESDYTWLARPGDGSNQPPEEPFDPERRMIVIPAVPSSGTSMVAGVLFHLGVNMGNCKSEAMKRRGYLMWEDADVGVFSYIPNGPLDKLANMRIRFREYINYRFNRQDGQLGVKTLPTIWLWDRNPADWPIDVLDVRRNIKTSMTKDAERLANREVRNPEDGLATAWQVMQRVGGVASMDWAREMLLKFHPPKLTVDYDEFRADPPRHIEAIVDTFGIQTTDYKMTAALLSIEPGGRRPNGPGGSER